MVPLLSDATAGNWDKKAAFYQFKRGNSMGYSVVSDDHRLTLWLHYVMSESKENQYEVTATSGVHCYIYLP